MCFTLFFEIFATDFIGHVHLLTVIIVISTPLYSINNEQFEIYLLTKVVENIHASWIGSL